MRKSFTARVPMTLVMIGGGLILCVSAPRHASANQDCLVYVTNTDSNDVQVVDIDTGTFLTSIPVGDTPVDIVASPDWNTVYVSNRGSNTISVINTTSNVAYASISVPPAPEGLAISPDGNTLYVANTYANTVAVIDTGSLSITANVAVGNCPAHLAVASTGNPLYVTNRNSGTLSVVDTSTLRSTAEVPVGSYPWSISLSNDGSTAYISNKSSSTVTMFSTLLNSVIGTVQVGVGPASVLVNPDPTQDTIFVNNTEDGNVQLLRSDGSTQQSMNLSTGAKPYGLGVTPHYNSVLVPDYGNGYLMWYKAKLTGVRPAGSMQLGGKPYAVTSILHQVN